MPVIYIVVCNVIQNNKAIIHNIFHNKKDAVNYLYKHVSLSNSDDDDYIVLDKEDGDVFVYKRDHGYLYSSKHLVSLFQIIEFDTKQDNKINFEKKDIKK